MKKCRSYRRKSFRRKSHLKKYYRRKSHRKKSYHRKSHKRKSRLRKYSKKLKGGMIINKKLVGKSVTIISTGETGVVTKVGIGKDGAPKAVVKIELPNGKTVKKQIAGDDLKSSGSFSFSFSSPEPASAPPVGAAARSHAAAGPAARTEVAAPPVGKADAASLSLIKYLSINIFSESICKEIETKTGREISQLKILELGSGNGFLYNCFLLQGKLPELFQMSDIDISYLDYDAEDNIPAPITLDAKDIGSLTTKYDVVIDIDGLTPMGDEVISEYLSNVSSILEPNGLVLSFIMSEVFCNQVPDYFDKNKEYYILTGGDSNPYKQVLVINKGQFTDNRIISGFRKMYSAAIPSTMPLGQSPDTKKLIYLNALNNNYSPLLPPPQILEDIRRDLTEYIKYTLDIFLEYISKFENVEINRIVFQNGGDIEVGNTGNVIPKNDHVAKSLGAFMPVLMNGPLNFNEYKRHTSGLTLKGKCEYTLLTFRF